MFCERHSPLEFRGSYHAKEVPDVPQAALAKELEFYGLPKTLLSEAHDMSMKLTNSRRFLQELIDQIHASMMQSYIPLEVWVYDKLFSSRRPEKKWYIGPEDAWKHSQFFNKDAEHFDLLSVINGSLSIHRYCTTMQRYVLLKVSGKSDLSLAVFDISALETTSMEILNQEAAKQGLKLEQRYLTTAKNFKLPYLYLSY